MTLIISTVTVLVAAILVSIVSSFLHHFSVNYVSLLIGLLIGLIPVLNHLVAPFHSEVFMYIVAPLIYFEGQTTRINLVRQSVGRIVGTAVILVIIMTLISGSLLGIMGIPIALAFLCAALSTPTDATATDAVSEGLIVPKAQSAVLKFENGVTLQ